MNHREEKKKIYGQIILELREKNNLTQAQLGEKININSNAISKWENGVTLPNEENIVKLNKIFNVSIENIYNNNMKQNKKSIKIQAIEFIEKHFVSLIAILTIIFILFIILLLFFINNSGSIIEMPNRISISLSNIILNTPKINSSNFETSIYINNVLIYKIGDIEDGKENNISLNEYLQNININLSNELMLTASENLDGKQLVIKVDYTVNNEIKVVEMTFLIKKVFSSNQLFYWL